MKCLMIGFVAFLSLAHAQSNLKSVDFENETSESKSDGPADGPALSPEDSKKLKEDLAILKARQEESKKILEEMDNEEE